MRRVYIVFVSVSYFFSCKWSRIYLAAIEGAKFFLNALVRGMLRGCRQAAVRNADRAIPLEKAIVSPKALMTNRKSSIPLEHRVDDVFERLRRVERVVDVMR